MSADEIADSKENTADDARTFSVVRSTLRAIRPLR